jgi:hypothetical protein
VLRGVKGSSSSELVGEDAISLYAGLSEVLRANAVQGGSCGLKFPVDTNGSIRVAIVENVFLSKIRGKRVDRHVCMVFLTS